MKTFITKLKRLNACSDAIEWAKQYNTWQEVWDNCERADWLLWIAGKMVSKEGCSSKKEIVFVACKCTRTVLKFIPKKEKRPLKAIQTAEAWVKGKATIEEVRKAAYAAAAATAAYAAAYAAADAAYTAYAAYAAATAAAAADAAATAAYTAADAYAARLKQQKKMCKIVRKHLKVTL